MKDEQKKAHEGELLAAFLKNKGYAIGALAEKIGMSRQALHGNLQKELLNREFIVKIEAAIDIPILPIIQPNDNANSRVLGAMDGGEIGKTSSGVDYMEMGDGRYLVFVPLVTEYSYGGYLRGYKDPEYVENMPKHSIVVSAKPHGIYVSFEMLGDSMDNGLKDAIEQGDTVTGRLIDKKFWTSKLHLHRYREYTIVHKGGIITKEIYKHDVEQGIIYIRSKNEDKSEFPDDVIYLKDVEQLYNVIEVSKKRK